MAIKISCPNGCELKVPDRFVGRRVRCPRCRASFDVTQSLALPPVTETGSKKNEAKSDSAAGGFPQIKVVTSGKGEAFQKDATDNTGSAKDLISRSEQSRQEKVVLCRFYGFLLAVLAIGGAFPALLAWWHWLGTSGEVLPFWVSLSAAAAVWQILFAILLCQVPDWSSLKAAAAAQLFVIFAFGLCATIFALNEPAGWFNQYLQMTSEQFSRGSMWCVAMLCLAVIASLGCYREGHRWKRMEELIHQLVNDKEVERR